MRPNLTRVGLFGILLGVLLTVATQAGCDYVRTVNFRLDRIENYLAGQEMQRQMQQGAPQSAPERSHKGELSKPQRWKV